MKKLIALIILVSSYVNAQFYEITYETQVQTYYTEKGIKVWEEWVDSPKELEDVIELNRNPPKEQFKFIYNEQLSKVVYQPKVSNNQYQEDIMVKKLPYNINGDVINNYQSNQFSYEMDVYGKKYLVKDNLIDIDLVDTGNKKKLIGFDTFEAIGKKDDLDIIIWYTKQIPYTYTPDIYSTKNGFILELHYKMKNDESEMINSWLAIDKKEIKKAPKISVPTKGKIIKLDEVDKIWDDANEVFNNMNSEGVDKK
ncbi:MULTISPECIES: GLPGLI family protein [unclassified Empedobacter]|uniref:GLPGLI family protein n=1 Tax=unclassified Empedobacter TaxID=2643773 RepID=UPI0025C1DCCB|nr:MULTISPECIES: GLPGLI family protein [unclassified Empedobacter]